MSLNSSTVTTRFRFWLGLIRVVGLIVPQRLRADWRQEWEAELRHREAMLAEWDKLDWKHKLDLLRRSLGAFTDALLLQPQRWEDEMVQDLRYGVRMLLKHKGFTFIAVLTLALGIGANTALFSVIDAVLLRPLPFEKPHQLVEISSSGYLFDLLGQSQEIYLSDEERNATFANVAKVEIGRVSLTNDSRPERLQLLRATASLFPLLGVNPMMGRAFRTEEQKAGANRVTLLSHHLWQSHFGADTNVLGRTLQFSGEHFTVIGVMPQGFDFYVAQDRADLFVPMTPDDKLFSTEGWTESIGRLQPGVSLKQARALMAIVFQRLSEHRPEMKAHENTQKPRLTPLVEHWAGDLQKPLWILLGAVACVLLIACANAANLLLARAAARQKEVSIRAALGASRLRLMRQWMTESLLLSLTGGAVGLLMAACSVKVIIAVSPVRVPMTDRIGIDGRVLLFTLAISVLTGLLFGLAPTWQFSKVSVNAFLKEGGQRSTAGFSPRVRNLLTVVEIALALVLLLNAGLLVRSFLRILDVPLGFNPKNVLTLELSPTSAKYPEASQRALFYQQAIDRIRTLPGVEHVGAINHLPLVSGDFVVPIRFDGVKLPEGNMPTLSYRVASADYFRAMGLQLLAGRFLSESDTATSPRVAMIEQTFLDRLKRYMGYQGNLIGTHLTFRDQDYEIVGVVADVKHQAIDANIYPGFYLPLPQRPPSYVGLAIRTTIEPASLTSAVRSAIQAIDPEHPIYGLKTMEQHVADSISRRRFAMLIFSAFSSLALLLSAIGIYGVMSYLVTQRTHEIGIRMAMGAQASDVLRLVIGEGMKLALIGALLGVGGALALTRLVKTLLFGVSTTDPLTFIVIAAVLISVALLACYLPARKATKVDPMIALRHD